MIPDSRYFSIAGVPSFLVSWAFPIVLSETSTLNKTHPGVRYADAEATQQPVTESRNPNTAIAAQCPSGSSNTLPDPRVIQPRDHSQPDRHEVVTKKSVRRLTRFDDTMTLNALI